MRFQEAGVRFHVFSVKEIKILRRPLISVATDNDVVGLLRMTSAGEFVILRERHAVVEGGEENISAYFG